MGAVDTCLTPLYVMADDFCTPSVPPAPPPGPPAALSRSAVGTWARGGQGQRFGRARGFSRDAQRPLRAALPSLPPREQCTRPVRPPPALRVAVGLPLVRLLAAQRWA